jgi:DNA polymerase-1
MDARLIMQVHDELVLEVRTEDAQKLAVKISELMSNAAQLDVELRVAAGIGQNWDQAH